MKFFKREKTIADDSFHVVFDQFHGNFINTSCMRCSRGGESPLNGSEFAVLLSYCVVLEHNSTEIVVTALETGSIVAVDVDAIPTSRAAINAFLERSDTSSIWIDPVHIQRKTQI